MDTPIFVVTMEQEKNRTWQGEISAGEHTISFQSELELLRFMDQTMEENHGKIGTGKSETGKQVSAGAK